MKLIPLRQAQMLWLNGPKQKKLHSLTLYTFKKDRSVTLKRQADELILIEEGFLHQETLLKTGQEKKLLKEAFAREFPRSSRVYVQQIDQS